MMDKTTKKTVAQMDGQLVAKVGEDENIFADCKRVRDTDKAHDEACAYESLQRTANALVAFRKCVLDFEAEFGFKPTVALLGYSDRQYLSRAYEKEYMDAFGVSAPYANIDGIKIRGGCDQSDGQIQLRKTDGE